MNFKAGLLKGRSQDNPGLVINLISDLKVLKEKWV